MLEIGLVILAIIWVVLAAAFSWALWDDADYQDIPRWKVIADTLLWPYWFVRAAFRVWRKRRRLALLKRAVIVLQELAAQMNSACEERGDEEGAATFRSLNGQFRTMGLRIEQDLKEE